MANERSSITCLKGISTVREKSFLSLGIRDLGDLIKHFPRGYQNRGDIGELTDEYAVSETPRAYILTVATDPKTAKIRANLTITKFKAFDDSGVCEITYYNRPYADKTYVRGSTHRFYGKLVREKRTLKLNSPISEPYFEGIKLLDVFPIYPLSNGLTQKLLSGAVSQALDLLYSSQEKPVDPIPGSVREKYGLCTLEYAYKHIHFPNDTETLAAARKRLAFEELFLLSTFLGYSKRRSRSESSVAMNDTSLDNFLEGLSFTLTSAQSRVCGEIAADMAKKVPMSRLVSGDVGSGKTVCAAAAAYIAIKNGTQAALMAPTEILANQHYEDLSKLFDSFGYKTALLTGSTTAAEKRGIYTGLKSGEIDFVIGTHAILNEKAEFNNLGLVITDEQHRFGVNQRAALGEKRHGVHTLVMSATPIPRTLALIIYGDLDISQIDEMPPGRQRVDTFVVNEGYRERLYAFMKKQVDAGHRVYVVCPTVEKTEEEENDANLSFSDDFEFFREDEKLPLKSAVDYAKQLKEEIFPELGIGYIHGKMKSSQKEKVMAEFVRGDIQILVSTTVIEVGVNVPQATLMIVENAERFGLSQLHQLRGRVGRGKDKSYCVLVSDTQAGSKSAKRLEVMRTTYDGYKIAEKDLEQRGPGDFMSMDNSIRQHGKLKLKLAEFSDTRTLLDAACAAREVLDDDPSLEKSENKELREHIESAVAIRLSAVN